MNAEYLIKTGRKHFTALMGVLIALSAINSLYEIVFGVSYGMLGVQIASTALIVMGTVIVLKGFRRRNLLFAILLFSGIFSFYEAGTRTDDLRKVDMGAIPLVTLVLGLALIFGAIYLLYSTEIKTFLDQKVIQRDRIKEESLM